MSKIKSAKSVFIEIFNENSISHIISDTVELPPLDKYGILIQVKACGLTCLPDYGKTFIHLLKHNLGINRIGAGFSIAGTIIDTGNEVTTFVKGDQVVGMVPLDSDQSGCSDYVLIQESLICLKPEAVSFVDAAGSLEDALKSYFALHNLGHIRPTDTVLVLGGATSFGSVCIQLARDLQAKVITTYNSEDEKQYIQSLHVDISQSIQLDKNVRTLLSATMLETANLGVDIIIDQRPKQQFQNNHNGSNYLPSNHEIISCLGVGGRWITTSTDLQLDPPNSSQLMLRCASICFLFEQTYLLSGAQLGKYQHILKHFLNKLDTTTIHPNIHHTVGFDGVVESLQSNSQIPVGRVVMTNLP